MAGLADRQPATDPCMAARIDLAAALRLALKRLLDRDEPDYAR
jgi:hypothetical protein